MDQSWKIKQQSGENERLKLPGGCVTLVQHFFPVLIQVMMKYNFLAARSEKGCENDILWSEMGSGFAEPGGTPTPIIPSRTSS